MHYKKGYGECSPRRYGSSSSVKCKNDTISMKLPNIKCMVNSCVVVALQFLETNSIL